MQTEQYHDEESTSATSCQESSAEDTSKEKVTPNTLDDVDVDESHTVSSPVHAMDVGQWRVARSLLTLRNQINAKTPDRNKGSDGTIGDSAHQTRQSDHNPWVRDGSVGVVTALDITHDPDRGCSANDIAEAIRTHRDVRVKYIIWNRRIASSSVVDGHSAWEWRRYSGANPHTQHIHISVKSSKHHYDSTTSWVI